MKRDSFEVNGQQELLGEEAMQLQAFGDDETNIMSTSHQLKNEGS